MSDDPANPGTGSVRLARVEGAAADLLGVEPATLEGPANAFLSLLATDEDHNAVGEGLQAAIADGVSFERLVHIKGRPLRLTLKPGPFTDGARGVIGLLVDASAEVAERDGRERAEMRFRKAFMATPGLFAISDPADGRHVDVNDRWLDVMGWTRDEVIGRTAAELGVWADAQDRSRIVAKLAEYGRVREFETRFRTRTGAIREFLVAGEVIELDGESRLLLVAHDVTERNEAQRALAALNVDLEQRVENRTSALRAEAQRREETEQRLRAIMDGVADAVVTADAKGRIITFNPAAERLFRLDGAEVVGTSINRLMPPAYAVRHDDYIADFLTSRQGSVLGLGRELPAQRSDGTLVPVEVALSHLNHGGEHLFTAVIRDVSERKEQEALLRAAKDAAEEANRAKSAFLSSMSHELRTPMNAILGFAQLMRAIDGESLTPRNNEYIGHILSAGHHLLSLIDDVLDLSKIEAGRITLSLEPVALDEVLSHVVNLLTPLADRFQVTVQTIADPAPGLRVWADSVRLGQVLINLGSNAAKYNRPGGWMKFGCSTAPERPGYVRVVVADNGQGIPVHRLSEVFQPFNRLGAESGSIEGTGIGLSIARQLVEMMGGAISVDSEPGRGTVFSIDLPIADEMAGGMADPYAEARPRHIVGTSVSSQAVPDVLGETPWTILYVEDVSSNVRLMAGVLSRYPNVRLLSAPTAENGLELARTHRPDLVLVDINLPGADGFHLLHQMRGTPELANIPVIALTARASPREQDRGRRAGFDAFLSKPLDVGRFLAAANGALARRRRENAEAITPPQRERAPSD
ncbi:MAG: PAS domain S-box protein [Rhodospirillaceae bacterium]